MQTKVQFIFDWSMGSYSSIINVFVVKFVLVLNLFPLLPIIIYINYITIVGTNVGIISKDVTSQLYCLH